MTNGEKLEQVFPDGICPFSKNWLDYEYKEPTTKNDLGVDCISRKSVITIIQNHWWNCRDIDKLVNELPPVTPQESRWIPVSERLPEEQDEYLVTWTAKGFRDKPFMRMIEFDVEDREWILDKDMKEIFKDVTITAWQPLPESYKENKE